MLHDAEAGGKILTVEWYPPFLNQWLRKMQRQSVQDNCTWVDQNVIDVAINKPSCQQFANVT